MNTHERPEKMQIPPDPGGNALFDLRPTSREVGIIEQSVRQVIEALRTDGLITGKYIAVAATLAATASAVDEGMKGGPKGVSVATAQLTKLLMEGLAELPEPTHGADPFYDALDAQLRDLTDQALTPVEVAS